MKRCVIFLVLVVACSVDATGLLPAEDAGLGDATLPDVAFDAGRRECALGASQPCRSIGACENREQGCVDGIWGECIETVNGGMAEVCDMGNVDEDCDGMSNEGCACVDGEFPCGVSDTGPCMMGVQRCVDGVLSEVCEGAVLPQDETCNEIDDDCDMNTDEGRLTTFFTDGDGDGVGTAPSAEFCVMPADAYASMDGDCDDGDPERFPDNLEVCDQKDNDCDGPVDEDVATTPYYPDGDGDGYGNTSAVLLRCADPGGNYVTQGGDCRDMNEEINPGVSEVCDLVDNNCSGTPDDGEVCREDCEAFTYLDHVYQFCQELGGFWQSRNRCRDMGGEEADQYVLVTVDDMLENSELNTRGEMISPGGVWWIGLTDAGSDNEGNYRWVSGADFSYTHWDSDEPNDSTEPGREDCVEMRPNGRWNDQRCNTDRLYICEQVD